MRSRLEKNRFNQLLYYEAQSVAVGYSDDLDATGEFDIDRVDIDRMIDQKPFLKVTYPGTIVKPKKLIITDWSKKYKINSLSMDWQGLFEAAKRAGAEVYVMLDEPVKVTEIEQLYLSLPKIKPVPYKDLIKKLAKKNISSDEAEIIDYLKVQEISDETGGKFVVDLNDFREISIEEFASAIIPTFNPNGSLAINVTLPDNFNLFKQLIAAGISINYLSLNCKYCSEQELGEYISYFKKEMHSFAAIKLLKIWTEHHLDSLLELCPNVETLTLERSKIPTLEQHVALTQKLKVLEINGCINTSNGISDLVLKSPNLEVLTIRNMKKPEKLISLGDEMLKHLKKLDMQTTSLRQQDFYELLDKCHHLEEINIGEMVQDNSLLTENVNPFVKSIKLSAEIPLHQMNLYFRKFPNLERIEIHSKFASALPDDALKELGNWPLVKEITLSSTAKDDDLSAFLKQFPNVNKLRIEACTNLSGTLLNNINPAELEYLSITDSRMEEGVINNLLNATPHLTHLEINNVMDFNTIGLKLPALTSLKVDKVSNLNETLKCFPNLQTLEITGDMIEGLDLIGLDFKSLSTIKLQKVFWFSGEFNQFLKSAPNLSYVKLSSDALRSILKYGEMINWQNVKIDLSDRSISLSDAELAAILPHALLGNELPFNTQTTGSFIDHYFGILPIKKLNLVGSLISDERLVKLITISPSLTEINVSCCDNIDGSFVDKLPANLPIEKFVSRTNSTLDQIKKIIAKCPNLKKIDILHTKIDLEQLGKLIVEYPNINFESKLKYQLNKLKVSPNEVNEQNLVLGNPDVNSELKEENSAKEGIKDFLFGLNNVSRQSQEHNITPFKLKLTPEEISKQLRDKLAEETFDAKTSQVDELHARQIFTYKEKALNMLQGTRDPEINSYRLQVFNGIQVKEKIEFIPAKPELKKENIKRSQDLLQLYEQKYKSSPDIYHGSLEVELNNDEWYPLPSLTTQDKLLNLESRVPLEVAYCNKNQLYYIRRLEKGPSIKTNISFLIKSPKPIQQKKLSASEAQKSIELFKTLSFTPYGKLNENNSYKMVMALPLKDRINYLIEFCNFDVGDLSFKQPPKNDIEKLNALIQQRVGACRHRSWVFMALAQELGIKARIIINDCHTYVEVFENNAWQKKDLGGYPVSELKVLEQPKMQTTLMSPKETGNLKPSINDPMKKGEATRVKDNTARQILSPDNPFVTWDTMKCDSTDFDTYLDMLISKTASLSPNQKNVLILVEPDQMESFHIRVTEYFKNRNKESFYLDNFKNVSEKSAIITGDDKLDKGDSSLVKFITNAKAGDAIIANWSNYNSAEVGYNSMMDENRKLKSTPINLDTLLINVLDKSKVTRMGEDFSSRNRIISECPNLAQTNLENILTHNTEDNENESSNIKEIEFFDAEWKKALLGQIMINGQSYKIENARLPKAINSGKNGLHLVNAPLHLPEFRQFITELLIKKKFEHNGQTYQVPDNFKIKTIIREYDFAKFNIKPIMTEISDKEDVLINRETVNYLFATNKCENGKLYTTKGLIKNEDIKNEKSLSLYVTENLTVQQWAKILTKAQKNNCLLNIKLKPGVTIPGLSAESFIKEDAIRPTNPNIVITNDLEFTEEELTQKHPAALVVSVNQQTTFSDIVEGTTLLTPDLNNLSFNSTQSDIWKRLVNNETVILKGQLSPQLARKLDSLFSNPPYQWVNGQKTYCSGRLILLTDDKNVFTSSKPNEVQISSFDFWQRMRNQELESENKILLEDFKTYCEKMQEVANINFSYGQLRDMFAKIKAGNYSNPFKPYFRLHPDVKSKMAKEIWAPKKPAKKIFTSVTEKRQERLQNELKTSPYIFIAGPSGVGKTSHILNQQSVHVGFENLQKWLTDGGTLFIDEANLEKEGAWDSLEGVFNKTPCVLYKGKLYPIKPHHKLIFTGNYESFEGRHKHKFFERHGQIFNFKEIPEKDLIKLVIEPALKKHIIGLNPQDLNKITHVFNHFYSFVNKVKKDHPLTPRNLKMMAMRLNVYLQDYKAQLAEYSVEQIASFAAMDEIHGVLNDANKLFEATDLIEIYENVKAKIADEKKDKYHDFLVTQSRRHPLRIIKDQFKMREYQLNNNELKTFDLSGVLIEGSAGIGKSKMVIEFLKDMNFQEGNESEEIKDGTKFYYHITPSDPDKMQKILLKAFHEGAVVIIDELNSLPLERIINQFSTGKDMNGNPPRQKGFFVIGTQNPVSYVGRQVLSPALQNRFYKLDFDEYPRNELVQICSNICDDKTSVEKIVDLYLTAKNFARVNHKYPEPTPRDLFAYVIKFNKERTLQSTLSLDGLANKSEIDIKYDEFIETMHPLSTEDLDKTIDTIGTPSEKTLNLTINPIFGYLGDSNSNGGRCLTKSILIDILSNVDDISKTSENYNQKPKTSMETSICKLRLLIEAFKEILERTPSKFRLTSYEFTKSFTDFFKRSDLECSPTQIKHIGLLKEAFLQELEQIPYSKRRNNPELKELLNPRNKNSEANQFIDFKQAITKLGAVGLTNTRLMVNTLMGFDDNQDEKSLKRMI